MLSQFYHLRHALLITTLVAGPVSAQSGPSLSVSYGSTTTNLAILTIAGGNPQTKCTPVPGGA